MVQCLLKLAKSRPGTSPTRRISIFRRNEDGSFIVFSVMMFTLMLLIAGISLDIERFETARTKLQNTADAAALAAASLTQSVPAQSIVDDYFAVANMETFLEDVDVQAAINNKVVTVEADVNVPTHFFNMIGVDNLATLVSSRAQESIGNVEISLVLDVSGSMGSNNKLGNLKDAAHEFIDIIYQDTAPGSVSTSIVPYSTQVSVGPEILSHYTALEDAHDNSHCLNFSGSDFDTIEGDFDAEIQQTMHFDARTPAHWSWSSDDPLWYNECSARGWTDVKVMSQTTTDLKNYVSAFQATDWTSIELGVKWGAAFLDPSFRPVVADLAGSGEADDDFADRPLEFDDEDVLKVLVVMTDGINTNQYWMKDPYRSGNSYVYVHYDAFDRPYYSIWGGSGPPVTTEQTETVTTTTTVCQSWDADGVCEDWDEVTTTTEEPVMNWYLANDFSGDSVTKGWRSTPFGEADAAVMSWKALWAEVPVLVFADRFLAEMGDMESERNAIKSARKSVNNGTKNNRTRDICTAAKDEGVMIYAIGFEAPQQAENLLRQCASSASHFFDVQGAEISQAFTAIAADINRLRLVQ
ncbi:MAG: pilus assembly protein TadG-related protein [Pseudomonadota bacterium]